MGGGGNTSTNRAYVGSGTASAFGIPRPIGITKDKRFWLASGSERSKMEP